MMRKRDDAAKAASMHVRWAAMRRRMKTYPVPRRTLAVALSEALNGTIELAGPEPIRQDDLVRRFLNATGDPRTVITDPQALYYGNAVNDQSLTPAIIRALARQVSRTGSATTPDRSLQQPAGAGRGNVRLSTRPCGRSQCS